MTSKTTRPTLRPARRASALALTGLLALGVAACGDDVVDDDVETQLDEAGDDAADTAEDLGDAVSEGLDDAESDG